MDTLSAFAKGAANRGKEAMVFDWITAARILKENKAVHAAAGLREDWEYTGGPILSHGIPMPTDDTYTYLASTWAVPELMYQTEDGKEFTVECFKMESELPGYNSATYWPTEAKIEFGIIDGECAVQPKEITDGR